MRLRRLRTDGSTRAHRAVPAGPETVPGEPEYRPLTQRERETLDFLLTVETDGVAELRQQVPFAVARGWDCGCASIDLAVDRDKAEASTLATEPRIEAKWKDSEPFANVLALVLWVEDGWLAGIEMIEVFDRHEDAPKQFPPPDVLASPRTL